MFLLAVLLLLNQFPVLLVRFEYDFKSSVEPKDDAVCNELVQTFAFQSLVRPEPLAYSCHTSRVLLLKVLKVLDVLGCCLLNINSQHLPVRLALVKQTHRAKYQVV